MVPYRDQWGWTWTQYRRIFEELSIASCEAPIYTPPNALDERPAESLASDLVRPTSTMEIPDIGTKIPGIGLSATSIVNSTSAHCSSGGMVSRLHIHSVSKVLPERASALDGMSLPRQTNFSHCILHAIFRDR